MENQIIEERLEKFFQKYPLHRYRKGDIILRPGESCSSVCFIKSGYVRLFSESKNGKEITINLFKPIFYLSLLFSYLHKENRYFFEAITDVEIWKAPVSDFEKYLLKDRKTLSWISRKLLQIMDDLIYSISETRASDSRSKIISILTSLGQKYGRQTKEGTLIDIQTTHRIIASLAGISRENASIQIKKIEKEGFIKQINRKILIPDIKKMEKLQMSGW